MPPLGTQAATLFLLAIPIACLAWTITHEEIFRQPRELSLRKSKTSRGVVAQKFFYMFTCEYCFSHYVTAVMLAITRFHLLYPDWRGYVIAGFSLVWIANLYMSLFARLRLDIREERLEIAQLEAEVVKEQDKQQDEPQPKRAAWRPR